MAQQIKYGKKTTLKPNFVVIGIVVLIMAAILLASALLGFIPWLNQPGQATNAPQIATSGGSPPTGPAGPATIQPTETPKAETETFEQLVEKFNTPEEIRGYMVKNFQKLSEVPYSKNLYTPDELIQAGGKGEDSDFRKFFESFLIKKGGDQWKVRHETFSFRNEYGIPKNDEHVLVVYTNPMDGNNSYMVMEPGGPSKPVVHYSHPMDGDKYTVIEPSEPPKPINEGFPIYNIGKSIIAGSFEEKRLGGTIAPETYNIQAMGIKGAGSGYIDPSLFEKDFETFSKQGKWPPRHDY